MDRNYEDWSRGRSPEAAWAECPRADWMIRRAAGAGAGPALLVRAAAAVWRLLWLARVPAGDPRPLGAIEAAEGWAARSSAEGPEERRAACCVLRKAADNSADCARLSYCRGEPLGAVWAASAAYEIAYTAFRLTCGARPEWCDWGDVLPSSPEELIRAADAVRAPVWVPRSWLAPIRGGSGISGPSHRLYGGTHRGTPVAEQEFTDEELLGLAEALAVMQERFAFGERVQVPLLAA